LKTVFSETSAARATSATVTASKPWAAKSVIAASAIASRVWRFLRSRNPSVVAAIAGEILTYLCYKFSVTESRPAIEVHELRKSFDELEAVRGVSFEVAAGEVFGFLGPNGAGKTTTINMLCTLAKPTGGSALVAGHDVVRERDDVRRHIGLVFQDPTLDGYLTAEQNLRLHAELYGVDSALVPGRMRQVLEMVGLWERRDATVMTFSGGMRRRLEIARGFLHSPRVLFLDEPTIGLDPQTRSSIWRYIAQLQEREEITIFMTTHYMDEAEFCDRIAIMDQGQIVALDTPAALKAQVGADRVRIQTEDDDAAIATLAEHFDLEATVSEGAVTFLVPSGEEFVPRLFAELGVAINSVSVSRPTLDDVFMSHTGTTIRDAEESGSKHANRVMMQMMTGGRR
jgi:ABC-2 type transport system ATP-binding protein